MTLARRSGRSVRGTTRDRWAWLPVVLGVVCTGLVSVVGCGPAPASPDGRMPIQGTVTLGGEPLAAGSIVFHPSGPRQTAGAGGPITSGQFRLPASAGLIPGSYIAEIHAAATEPATTSSAPAGGYVIEPITGADVPAGLANEGGAVAPPSVKPALASGGYRQSVTVSEAGPNQFEIAISR